MIHIDKPSLSVCAFGAGAAHAAVLALVLPVMITLPAAKDEAQGTVAIQVLVRPAPPASIIDSAISGLDGIPELEGEGDADQGVWTVTETNEITGSLPAVEKPVDPRDTPLMEQAALAEPVMGALPEAAVAIVEPEATLVEDAPMATVEENMELATVASTEVAMPDQPDFMPDVVPRPYRKPALAAVEQKVPAVEAKPKPVPRQRVTHTRPRPTVKPFKGILGGTRATPMAEFPFGAGR